MDNRLYTLVRIKALVSNANLEGGIAHVWELESAIGIQPADPVRARDRDLAVLARLNADLPRHRLFSRAEYDAVLGYLPVRPEPQRHVSIVCISPRWSSACGGRTAVKRCQAEAALRRQSVSSLGSHSCEPTAWQLVPQLCRQAEFGAGAQYVCGWSRQSDSDKS